MFQGPKKVSKCWCFIDFLRICISKFSQACKSVTVKDWEICIRTFFIENLILNIFYFSSLVPKINICDDISKKLSFRVYHLPWLKSREGCFIFDREIFSMLVLGSRYWLYPWHDRWRKTEDWRSKMRLENEWRARTRSIIFLHFFPFFPFSRRIDFEGSERGETFAPCLCLYTSVALSRRAFVWRGAKRGVGKNKSVTLRYFVVSLFRVHAVKYCSRFSKLLADSGPVDQKGQPWCRILSPSRRKRIQKFFNSRQK